ncbi:MAG: hypothetical protein Kow0098_25000 [Ignavibacteriaceae bacterium]
MILISGRIFPIGKSSIEIHIKLEGESVQLKVKGRISYTEKLIQILPPEIVFPPVSEITAVSIADHAGVMITTVIIAVLFMMVFADSICRFV